MTVTNSMHQQRRPIPAGICDLLQSLQMEHLSNVRDPTYFFLILAAVETCANEFKRVGFAQADGSLPKRRPFGMKFPNAESDIFRSGERKRITLV